MDVQAARSTSRLEKIVGFILVLLISGVFYFSAIAKIYSIRSFEWAFIDLGIRNWPLAQFCARFMIGVELVLASLMLAHIRLRQFTYKAMLAFLAVMILYLIYLMLDRHGNSGNCGCFGDQIEMSPLAALVKNLITAGLVGLLFYIYPGRRYRGSEIVGTVLVIASLFVPFILSPLKSIHGQTVNLNPLYSAAPKPSVDLRKGRHIVAFMSLSCPHCRDAARQLGVIYKRNPGLPIYFVLGGPDFMEPEFLETTRSEAVPHILVADPRQFRPITKKDYVPVIFWIDNGRVYREITAIDIHEEEIKRWSKD